MFGYLLLLTSQCTEYKPIYQLVFTSECLCFYSYFRSRIQALAHDGVKNPNFAKKSITVFCVFFYVWSHIFIGSEFEKKRLNRFHNAKHAVSLLVNRQEQDRHTTP